MRRTKKILLWVLSVFLIVCGLTFLPSISSILFLSTAILIIPINRFQKVLQRVFPSKRIKGLLCALLAFVAIMTSPTGTPAAPSEQPSSMADQIIVEEKDNANQSTGDLSLPHESGVNQEGTSHEETGTDDDAVLPNSPAVEGESPIGDVSELSEPTDNDLEKNTESGTLISENSFFEIHFIDVGQADAALVICDGHSMLIDGGNSGDSSLIYSYLKNHEINYLDYIIATHGHEDHVGGLSGALNYATVGKAYCSVNDYDSEAFDDFVKYLGKQGKSITVPNVGETFKLGNAAVEIVGVNGDAGDPNNSSIVLRIEYGETSFLFTGDAEREAEQTILNSGRNLESTVLKVGHHGSESSTSYVFLRAVAPKYGVISVGNGNSYGHPTEDTLSRLRDADVTVYRTDLQGTVICNSDGEKVSFSVSKNKDADTLAPPATWTPPEVEKPTQSQPLQPDVNNNDADDAVRIDYIGNKNTKKFHYDWCGSVGKMKESNKFYYTGTRDEMIAKGYKPCGNCHP